MGRTNYNQAQGILIFLPGLNEIYSFMDSLYEAIPEIEANSEKYQVIPLHSVLSDGQN